MTPYLLTHLAEPKLPTNLLQKILSALERAQLRQLRLRYSLMLSGFATSLGYVAWQWSTISQEISSSSFVEFVRLAISDPDIIASYGQDFFLGLLESLPTGTILVISLVIFFLCGAIAIRHMTRNLKRSSSLHHSFS